jgi:hypothetical protein
VGSARKLGSAQQLWQCTVVQAAHGRVAADFGVNGESGGVRTAHGDLDCVKKCGAGRRGWL